MKWLQHMTDAHDDEFLKELVHKFGMEGYGVWWATLELCGKIVKIAPAPGTKEGFQVTARFESTPQILADTMKITVGSLEKVYRFCADRKKFRFEKSRKRWVIDWPKVLEFKDNATADLIARYRRELGSNLDVTSGLHEFVAPPIGEGGRDPLRGGGGGDADTLWALTLARQFSDFCQSPGVRAMQNAILDLIRQEVPRRAIEEAPMNPAYRKLGFYKIVRELEHQAPNNNGGLNGTDGRRRPELNTGANQVLGHFALKPGELDAKVQQRIAERERREGQGSVDVPPQGGRDGGPATPEHEVPGADKV